MKKKIYIKVSGRVQGVYFRYYTSQEAQKLDLTGWVRNTEDGGVEIVAEGEESKLKKLLAWTYQGPSNARVKKVEFEWKDFEGDFEEFKAMA